MSNGAVASAPAPPHACDQCEKCYQSRTSLNAHRKSAHQIGRSVPKIHCHFDGCDFRCYKLNQLVNHLTELHQLAVQFLSLSFHSKDGACSQRVLHPVRWLSYGQVASQNPV